jgi:hypothetical protein
MTKFTSAQDAGYIAVRDQLWLWIDTIQAEAEADVVDIRARRMQKFATIRDTQQQQQHFGPISNNGGVVFQGNQTSGGDLNFRFS